MLSSFHPFRNDFLHYTRSAELCQAKSTGDRSSIAADFLMQGSDNVVNALHQIVIGHYFRAVLVLPFNQLKIILLLTIKRIASAQKQNTLRIYNLWRNRFGQFIGQLLLKFPLALFAPDVKAINVFFQFAGLLPLIHAREHSCPGRKIV